MATDVVTLDYVKKHLTIPSTATGNDAELQDVIDAAVQMAEDRVGPIDPVVVTENHDGGASQIVLRKYPVVSVTSVTDVLRSVVYSPTSAGSTDGYYYQLDSGVITLYPTGWSNAYLPRYAINPRFAGGLNTIQVVYTAGRATVTAKQQYAIAEFVRHLWQTQQGSRMNPGSDESMPGYLVPYLVQQAFGLDVSPPNVA